MKCNNCDIELPVEQLRVPYDVSGGLNREHLERRVWHHGNGHGRQVKSIPILYYDVLLCPPCKVLFKNWRLKYA